MNDSCASTHGNIRVNSIFISPSGEWKLGGFDVLSSPSDDTAVLYVCTHLTHNYLEIHVCADDGRTHPRRVCFRDSRNEEIWLVRTERVSNTRLSIIYIYILPETRHQRQTHMPLASSFTPYSTPTTLHLQPPNHHIHHLNPPPAAQSPFPSSPLIRNSSIRTRRFACRPKPFWSWA